MHKNETPHNRENARTQGVICLVPSGNQKVGYRFMSLNTKKITRYSWDEIPMPDTVIDLVNNIGGSQPEYFIFTNHRGQ